MKLLSKESFYPTAKRNARTKLTKLTNCKFSCIQFTCKFGQNLAKFVKLVNLVWAFLSGCMVNVNKLFCKRNFQTH